MDNIMNGQMTLFEEETKAVKKVSQDFGEHIGGARKELWSTRGLALCDIAVMNDAEKAKFVKKDNIWKKPDYDQMIESGTPVDVAYAIKMVRDGIPAKPVILYGEDKDPEIVKTKQENYIRFVTLIRDGIKDASSKEDFMEKQVMVRNQIVDPERSTTYTKCAIPDFCGLFQTKLVRALWTDRYIFAKYDSQIKKKQFGVKKEDKIPAGWSIEFYSPDGFYSRSKDGYEKDTYFISKGYSVIYKNISTYGEALELCQGYAKQIASKSPRKASSTPKQLKHIRRIGLPDVRNGRNITGDDFLKDFNIRGGEFGNWMSEKDAQANLNMAYEAFCDFADILGIPKSSVSFDGKLAIAFGARGKGTASAHYEPLREVINITKMKGAGSLGHEMFHALDDLVAKKLGLSKMMTESGKKDIPESVQRVIDAMQYRKPTKEEVENTKAKKIESAQKRVLRTIDYVFPETNLSDEQKATRNDLVTHIMNDVTSEMISSDNLSTEAIEELSSYKKKETGRVISKDNKKNLYWAWYFLKEAKTMDYSNMKFESDYYKESKKMDKYTSKDKFGYWSSTVEMFARAGACYLTDSLKVKDAKDDYLSGHSESCIGMDKNLDLIYAMPRGEERKAINVAIHDMIEDLKGKNLI